MTGGRTGCEQERIRGNIDRDLDVERADERRVQERPASRHRATRNRPRYPSSNMARIVSMVMNIRSGRSWKLWKPRRR